MNEKFILTVKAGLHLGHIKETFGAGAVIEHDAVNGRLIIDGRKFDDTRDLDILKRQALKFPQEPWIVPFSEELMTAIRNQRAGKPAPAAKPRPGENMQVIKSDEDLNETIDISATQISKRNNEAKEAARQKVKTEGMPIIRGDETVQERLASLKDKTDINSMAERVRLKRESDIKMPIVQDDSLGQGVGKNQIPLNAGQQLPSRESVEAKSEDARAQAEARKKDADARRKAVGEAPPVVAGIEVGENESDADKDSEIAALKAKIAALEATAETKNSVRRPVTTAERAKEITDKK